MEFIPILMKGEKLAETASKSTSGGPKDYPYEYEEAKSRILANVENINKELKNNKDYYLENEIIINVRMNEKFLAKSYMPTIFQNKESMEFVGARIYKRAIIDKKEVKSKLYFLKCSKENLEWLVNDLKSDNFNESEKKQLRSIEKVDFLQQEEKTLGFEETDEVKCVEIVLHPLMEQLDFAISTITKYLDNDYEIRTYKDGPTFILGNISEGGLGDLSKYNFLRTVHPIRNLNLPILNARSSDISLPQVPVTNSNLPKVKIGVFDGGVNPQNRYLKDYVNYHEISSVAAENDYLQHGNAVCGAILYGELNKYKNSDVLPEPIFTVESFRVLPEKNLYKVIDNIEKTVKTYDDIDIYNISFGPRGPILDDQIDRFTYSLDVLALDNKIFTIAVGNDGDAVEPFNRIQVPSDSVNNISVGSYSFFQDHIYRSSYSCIGLGREGGKVKPDLLAFGGDERNLFQLVDLQGKKRLLQAGTSFAAPLVARRLGQLVHKSKQLTPLVSRTLLLHTAKSTLGDGSQEGFGIMSDSVEETLNCSPLKVTVLYTGFIFPSRSIKLPIPLPDKDIPGTINISWTNCTLTGINTKDSDLYTNSCIEETFYPNSNIYSFTKKGKKSISLNIVNNLEEIKSLISQGYRQGKNPVGDTAKRQSEIDRRLDYKWDTVSKKAKGKVSTNIKDPFLIISALSRDDDDVQKIQYCIAVTIEAKKYVGNMYQDIMNKYKVLEALNIEIDIEQEIKENESKI